MTPATEDTRLLREALSRLKDIGLHINQLNLGAPAALDAVLHLIVESATTIVPGATAIIYTCDAERQALDPVSRVAAGAHVTPLIEDQPRPAGLGARAIALRRPVLSYAEPDLAIHPAKRAAGAQVVACLPLVIADEPLGVLYIYLLEQRRLTDLELLLLANLVNQAATAIHHAGQFSDVRRNLARKEDELALLRHAGLLISSRTRLDDTLEAILQMALEVTGARYGIFRLVDPTGKKLVMRAIAGDRLGQPAIEALPLNTTSIMGWVAVTRQPLNVPDVWQPPWSRIYYPLDHALQMRADLAVPLIGAGGRLEGVLNLESPQVAAFSEADSHLLQALASQAVIAIQEVRLLDGLRETAERLLTQDVQAVLAHLVELACSLLNATSGAVWTVQQGALAVRAATAAHAPAADAAEEGTLAQRALITGTALAYDQGATGDRILVMPVLSADDRRPIAAFIVRQAGKGGAISQTAKTLSDTENYPSSSAPVRVPSSPTLAESGPSEWDNKVLGILAHYAALTLANADRQAALAEAQQARAVAETFAALGDIAANLLHHLNNQVGAIPVRIEGIQDKCAPALAASPYLAANLAEIERAAQDALATVRERLSLLRPIEVGPVAVADCVADALARTRLPAGVRVTAEGVRQLPPVLAGRESLALVIANLLENAAEALNGRGAIVISGSVQAGWVIVTVRDDGPGIPPELQTRIFEFNFSGARRSDRPLARNKLGFGLWWVKTVMARLGGGVSVTSDGQGGATFLLRLPRAGAP